MAAGDSVRSLDVEGVTALSHELSPVQFLLESGEGGGNPLVAACFVVFVRLGGFMLAVPNSEDFARCHFAVRARRGCSCFPSGVSRSIDSSWQVPTNRRDLPCRFTVVCSPVLLSAYHEARGFSQCRVRSSSCRRQSWQTFERASLCSRRGMDSCWDGRRHRGRRR